MLLNIKTFVSSVNHSWLNFKLQTQIILATTILFLVLISSITSGPLTTIYKLTNNSIPIQNDLTILLNDNLVALLTTNQKKDILPLFDRLYRKSTNLRYIVLIDKNGQEYSVPYSYKEIISNYNNTPTLVKVGEGYTLNRNNSLNNNTQLQITNLTTDRSLGLLLIGLNSNFLTFNKILATNSIVLFVVALFIITVVLGTFFIKVTITKPLNEVSQALNTIAVGNFSKRINLRFGGELGDLVNSFNELGRRLQLYEEKNSEQLLGEKVKLESLITTITDGAILLDTNLRILLINTTAIKIFGWKTKERLIGTPIWDHLPIVLQKKMFVTLQGALFEARSTIVDGKIENEMTSFPSRSIRMILNIVYDSQDNNKLPIGIGITIQDMTKKFELDKTQNRFMSNISHELRTPLFNIKSFIETIQEYDYTLSNWQKRYFLDIVNKETNRLTRLVNDILCISKLDSLKNVPLGTTNLTETINQTTANYQILARDKNLYLHSQIFSNSLKAQGNKDLLLQVLINLVGNALKFTYKKGEVIIRSYPLTNQKLRIEIVDTGVGIGYRYQQSIFQRFYRIENEVHTLKGTGLGLSIVDTILTEHKTGINVVSRYKVGSAFWFDLTIV